ncbi:MAG TPA: hypothetical protein VLH19_04970 [Patescibacteria group bacterium]|nr:hypothetical protein [Patescibacteria group bacterium]
MFTAILYCVSLFISFFIPGFGVISRLKLKQTELVFVLSFVVGLLLWGMQGWVFGYLHLRWLSYMYLVISLFAVYGLRAELLRFGKAVAIALRSVSKVLLFLVVIGVCVQSVQMIGSGLQSGIGMSFFRTNFQDGVYHLSLIESITREFPPQEPGAAGLPVANYHYWSDLILAEQSRVWRLPIPTLFFQFTPIFISIGTALALIAFLDLLEASYAWKACSLFFLFFGADLSYVVMLLLHHTTGFTISTIDNGATQFLNMPHAMAKFIFLGLLCALTLWLREKKWRFGILTGFIAALLTGVKIYFALLAFGGLFFVGAAVLIRFLTKKESKNLFIQFLTIGILTAVMAALIYIPVNKGAGGLDFYPLEWPKLFVAAENFDWMDLRYKLAVASIEHLTLKVWYYDALMIGVTLLAVFGTRLLGFMYSKKLYKKMGLYLSVFFVPITIIFTLIAFTTLQRSGNFNVFNFWASSITLLSIIASYNLAAILASKRMVLKIAGLVIVLLTLPKIAYETLKIMNSYHQHTDVVVISMQEQEALHAIDSIAPKDAIIQSDVANELDMSTPYVSYFSNRQTYISGQKVLETHNQPTLARLEELRGVFSSNSAQTVAATLRRDGVSYLYLRKIDRPELLESFTNTRIKVLFQNSQVIVYDLAS